MERSSRRQFLAALASTSFGAAWVSMARGQSPATTSSTTSPATAPALIDRKAVVARHAVHLNKLEPSTPLHVGNGDFAFGMDVTGMQTLAEAYRAAVPLHAMATWAWHAAPAPEGLDVSIQQTARAYNVPGRERPVEYYDRVLNPVPTTAATTTPVTPEYTAAAAYLRGNPHRAALARVAFVTDAGEIRADAIADIDQSLDLWTGLVRSRFTLAGQPVEVTTAAHPSLTLVAFRVRSPLLATGALRIRIAFPGARVDPSDPDDWEHPESHETMLVSTDRPGIAQFDRRVNALEYTARASWSTPDVTRLDADGPHAWTLRTDADWVELAIEFAPPPQPATSAITVPSVADVFAASARGWERYWSDGGAVDFADCTDPRAAELERRVVRSQYVTAVHCAGNVPAPETGLACNAQYGKLRLDVAIWTAAHFAQWGRPALLERSMRYFGEIAPVARAAAKRQGYAGARWPGVTGGASGDETPGEAHPFWAWHQPHPIYFAEQIYRAKPTRETLDRYAAIVDETAQFMASFPTQDPARPDVLSLGPPIVPAQQRYTDDRAATRDPTFELAYWAWGLGVAQRWRERLGQPRDAAWDDVIKRLAKPTIRDGRYAAIGVEPFVTNGGHPSFLMALGFLPKTHLIDEKVMAETARWTAANWRWETAWGADFGVLAQTATRLGEPAMAIDALLRDAPTNRFVESGHHVPQAGMPVLLSANGALLSAVAMMAGGWDGPGAADRTRAAPGFPTDGRWNVRVEGFERSI